MAFTVFINSSWAETTKNDAMTGEIEGFYDLPFESTEKLRFSDEIQSQSHHLLQNPSAQFSLGALSYADDLMNCLSFGDEKGGRCGNCAKGVRHALMCLHKKMAKPAQMELILCGRGAYAYSENQCMEKMGFENVYDKDRPSETRGNCMVPGTVLVYRGHKVNNYTNCNRYQNGNYCGHIEIAGTDGGFHDTVCERKDGPRDEWGVPGSRILVACYQLKQWTDPSTWYR